MTKLQYAFKESKSKVRDEDYRENNKIEIKVEKNGTWTAYVKDEVGNVGTADVEIITVDKKAPVIENVTLKNTDSGWHKKNTICVSAKDKTDMEFRYICGTADSGWIKENEYEITQNGIWKIMVKDAAGNESSKELTVSDIDSKPPVILSVQPKKEVLEEATDIGTLEDRVSVTVNGAEVKDTESNLTDVPAMEGMKYSGETSKQSLYNNATNTSSNYTPQTVGKGEKGDRGATGAAGSSGKDGTSYYMHVKYADNASGTEFVVIEY